MVIFYWIVLGLAALLLAIAGITWGVYVANEHSDWRRLSVKVFRYAMVLVLLAVNVGIYAPIITVLFGLS